MAKEKFVIAPHMRLHEWVAEEKGYFKEEGLDYVYSNPLVSKAGKVHDLGDKVGAYQTYEAGRTCDVSSACHWTVNAAAASGHGLMYRDAYSVSPSAIFVPPESKVEKPEDLAGVPISVGFQSGSHYSTIQALEQWLKPEEIKLSFGDGLLFNRLDLAVDRKIPAVSLFSGPYYVCEQLGFKQDLRHHLHDGRHDHRRARSWTMSRKYYRALKRAQSDIDLRPELYTHFYLKELPERFHADGRHAAHGPRRAHRLRALHAGGVPGVAGLDRRARHLSRRHALAPALMRRRRSRWPRSSHGPGTSTRDDKRAREPV